MRTIILFILMLTIVGCKKNRVNHTQQAQSAKDQIYTCAMHPEVTSDAPGKCPKCGMDLVLKDTGSTDKDVSLNDLLLPTNEFVITQVPVTSLQRENNVAEITSFGKIEYDTKQVGSISARVAGRIEKLYVRYKYQKVFKGQRILDIYSPELLTAQQNLLFLIKNDPSNGSMLEAARQKLILLGMPTSQIRDVIRKGKPDFTVPLFSNYSGHIQKAGSSTAMGSALVAQEAMTTDNTVTAELTLKEGMYVQQGQNIFSVYNPDRAWVLLNIFSKDMGIVSKGQRVTVIPEAYPQHRFSGTIGFIEPFFRQGSKTLTARVYFDNSVAKIPIGSQVSAQITGHTKLSDWLPETAVLSLGTNTIVFIKKGKGFIAHKVITGTKVKEKIEILDGLKPQDTIVRNAQYLMDSESFIKTNN